MTSSHPPVPDPPEPRACDLFAALIGRTILIEGGERYTNDPNDRGGETRWGVTAAMARAAGYAGEMKSLPRDEALRIYRLFFWQQPGLDKIAEMCKPLAAAMLDLGVNCGPAWPGRWLQRSLNVLNQQALQWPDVVVDGQPGAMTRAALAAYLAKRGPEGVRVLLAIIRAMAGVRYVELAETAVSQEAYEFGWLSQRAFPAANAERSGDPTEATA